MLDAMQSLIDNPVLMKSMGKAARQYMEQRSFEAAFLQTWEMCHQDTILNSVKAEETLKMAI